MAYEDPSYVGNPGLPNGYVKPGYQKYYSVAHGVPPGSPPEEPVGGVDPPPDPPGWPPHYMPPTLPPLGCPPLDSVWSPGPASLSEAAFGYTPPISQPNDDGVTFPLHPSSVILKQGWHGLASTVNPINMEIYNAQLNLIIRQAVEAAKDKATTRFNLPYWVMGQDAPGTVSFDAPDWYEIQAAVQIAVLKSMLQGTNLWFELVLKPLTTGPFSNYYVIDTTPLPIPQGVDLSA